MAATTAVALCLIAVALIGNAAFSDAYTNHTVGGPAGWLFNSATNKSSADYAAWATNQTFNLGDYLIFDTTTNQTVIQTYNRTTYMNCSIDNSADNDTFSYNGGNSKFGIRTIISVALTIEGRQYYFSGAQDGQQCLNGMAFEIKVNHGVGLPPSLNQPPPPPYASPPTGATDEESPATTVAMTPPNGGSRTGGGGGFSRFVLMVFLMARLVV